jgi:hypothetical protein
MDAQRKGSKLQRSNKGIAIGQGGGGEDAVNGMLGVRWLCGLYEPLNLSYEPPYNSPPGIIVQAEDAGPDTTGAGRFRRPGSKYENMQCKIKSPSDGHVVTFSLDEAFLKLAGYQC